MPRVILKCDPNVDMYVEWSTVVDAPLFAGTRAEMLGVLSGDRPVELAESTDAAQQRMERADDNGSSALPHWGFGYWDNDSLILQDFWGQRGHCRLPRRNLLSFARRLFSGDRFDPAAGLVEEVPPCE